MAELVGDYFLKRLREWGATASTAIPATGQRLPGRARALPTVIRSSSRPPAPTRSGDDRRRRRLLLQDPDRAGDTGRRGLHVAQVLKLAHEHGAAGPLGPQPECLYDTARPKQSLARRVGKVAAAAAVLALAARVVSATVLRPEAP
jgi:hypothetical protein